MASLTVGADNNPLTERPWFMDNSDRCDVGNCGAQAFVRAVYPESDLYFCSHHARRNRDALLATALFVEDNSDAINVKASQSSADV